MRTVLVTGATGFIGNYVVEELLKNNYHVIASSSSAQRAGMFPWFSKVQYIPFDLAAFNCEIDCYAFFKYPEVMITPCMEGLPNYKAAFHYEVNLPRHFAFLQNMVQHGLANLSVTGTCFEYGMREGMLSENMPAAPANPYAFAKDALRKLLEALHSDVPFNFTWIRLFYMYGRGQNPNSLLSQLQKAIDQNQEVFDMSGGEQVRDYLPIEKVADYIVKIALQDRVAGIINCCSGQPISVKQLVANYLEERNLRIHLNFGYYPYTDYEPMVFWGDTKKLKQLLSQ